MKSYHLPQAVVFHPHQCNLAPVFHLWDTLCIRVLYTEISKYCLEAVGFLGPPSKGRPSSQPCSWPSWGPFSAFYSNSSPLHKPQRPAQCLCSQTHSPGETQLNPKNRFYSRTRRGSLLPQHWGSHPEDCCLEDSFNAGSLKPV